MLPSQTIRARSDRKGDPREETGAEAMIGDVPVVIVLFWTSDDGAIQPMCLQGHDRMCPSVGGTL
jgi:hypothetical protein